MTPARVQRQWFRVPLQRWLWKSCLFVAITALVLNPNLRIALRQVRNTFQPEALIQTNFTSLREINGELDTLIASAATNRTEPKWVERFVLKKIRYVTDYENWGNIEYWPTAEEVWMKQREDCDGRAILAASILRSRGYRSTKLVVGLKHMWVQLNENEKDPGKPEHVLALLSPERSVRLPMQGNPKADHFLRLAKSFLQPTALRETSADLMADIPAARKAILVTVLLLLCYHPCRSRRGLWPLLTLGLAASYLLADWSRTQVSDFELTAGLALLATAVVGALLMERLGPRTNLPAEARVAAGILS